MGMSGWRDDAPCAQIGGDVFFDTDRHAAANAKRVCLTCPVRTECAEFAIRANQTYGIWGGMAPKTIRAERRTA